MRRSKALPGSEEHRRLAEILHRGTIVLAVALPVALWMIFRGACDGHVVCGVALSYLGVSIAFTLLATELAVTAVWTYRKLLGLTAT